MSEERMKILQMVEEQKLSVEQAIKLLDAVKEQHPHVRRVQQSFEKADFEAKLTKLANNIESFAKDFGGKMEVTFKDMEPKIKKATKTVVEKTADLVNDISKAINESISKAECCCDDQCCCEQEACCTEEESCDCCCDEPKEN